MENIPEKIDLAKAKYFPDEVVLSYYNNLPSIMRPIYGVFCATDRDLALAQTIAPDYEKICYLLPEDVGLKRPLNRRL